VSAVRIAVRRSGAPSCGTAAAGSPAWSCTYAGFSRSHADPNLRAVPRPLPDEDAEARPRRDPLGDTLASRLPDLLRDGARAAEPPEMPPVGMAAAGCLRAALLIALFFMLALFGLSMILGGTMIQFMGQ
jgi:hypothetical protein